MTDGICDKPDPYGEKMAAYQTRMRTRSVEAFRVAIRLEVATLLNDIGYVHCAEQLEEIYKQVKQTSKDALEFAQTRKGMENGD